MGLLNDRSLLTLHLIPVAVLLIRALAVGNFAGVSADSGGEGGEDSAAPDLTAVVEDEWIILTWADWDDAEYATVDPIVVRVREADAESVVWSEFYVGGWRSASGKFYLRLDDNLDTDAGQFVSGSMYIFQVATWDPNTEAVAGVSDEVTVAVPGGSAPESQQSPVSGDAGLDGSRVSAQLSVPAQRQPSGLTAALSDNDNDGITEGVHLTWVPGTNPNYVQQYVWRRAPEVANWTEIKLYGVDVSEYTDTSDVARTDGNALIYRIRAEKINEKGGISNRAFIRVPGRVDTRYPADVRAHEYTQSVSDQGIRIVWASTSHTRYRHQMVLRREAGAQWILLGSMVWPAGEESQWLDLLSSTTNPPGKGVEYIYRVMSVRDDCDQNTISNGLVSQIREQCKTKISNPALAEIAD